MKTMKKYKMGSELKNVPAGKEKSLGKLPTEVRNKMGFKKMGGEKFLGKLMQMGGTIDMSEDFVEKMRMGGNMPKPCYKCGGDMKSLKKKQIGGSMPSRVNGYKK
jgi:hypothetical protein